jgi:hypothetical protein
MDFGHPVLLDGPVENFKPHLLLVKANGTDRTYISVIRVLEIFEW